MSPLSIFSVAIAPLLLAHLCESSPYKNQDSGSLNEHDVSIIFFVWQE